MTVKILGTLAADNIANQTAIAEAGGIPLLINLLGNTTSQGVQQWATYATGLLDLTTVSLETRKGVLAIIMKHHIAALNNIAQDNIALYSEFSKNILDYFLQKLINSSEYHLTSKQKDILNNVLNNTSMHLEDMNDEGNIILAHTGCIDHVTSIG